jgi:hypothetical protein
MMAQGHCEAETVKGGCVRSVVRPMAAFCLLAASAICLVVCLWRERDEWLSYFSQKSCCTPPVLVVSSDDWGGVSPPETVEDLNGLRDTLKSVSDAKGRPLVLTAYMNPAEPDFEAIRRGRYASYSYRYCYQSKPEIAARLRELHKAGLVDIEFHGREHFNIPLWLDLLKHDHPGYRQACDAGHIPFREGLGWDVRADPRLPFLVASFADAATYPPKSLPVERQREMIASGLSMMEKELGVKPVILTAPAYLCDTNTLRAMALVGIPFLDSINRGPRLVDNKGGAVRSRQWWDYGVEIAGIKGIVRNVNLEPSHGQSLAATMKEARRALLSGRPVVVSSHRWNYVRAVNPDRDRALLLLQEFAARIKDEAPDVVFLSASDLAKNLYLGGAEARREVELKRKDLSGAGRVMHGVRCIWLGHGRIRTTACATGMAFVWLCIASSIRKRLDGAQALAESP